MPREDTKKKPWRSFESSATQCLGRPARFPRDSCCQAAQ